MERECTDRRRIERNQTKALSLVPTQNPQKIGTEVTTTYNRSGERLQKSFMVSR